MSEIILNFTKILINFSKNLVYFVLGFLTATVIFLFITLSSMMKPMSYNPYQDIPQIRDFHPDLHEKSNIYDENQIDQNVKL